MSRFWQYFHESLNWPLIFRPGPVSALVKGLALYLDDVREDILWLRLQCNPATADVERLAAYGQSRGILRTRFDTDESYRLRVVNAFAWHKLGGKVQGLVRILAENGFEGAIVVPVNDVRRHDASFAHNRGTYNDGLCWAQFDVKLVEIPAQGLNADILAWFRWLVNEYKPARSILRAMSWRTSLADETDFSDINDDGAAWLTVKPTYEDARPWGFPLHNGSIRYNNGLFREHDGRLTYSGDAPHTRWEPAGFLHNALLDPLDVAVTFALTDAVRYAPRHNGALLYNGQGRRGELDVPAVEALRAGLRASFRETTNVQETLKTNLNTSVMDEVGRYHDGGISHGQRYISLHDGGFFHDGSRLRGQFGGNPDFSSLRHGGRARHNGTALHSLWGALPAAGTLAPVFTYSTLSDSAALNMSAGMEDSFTLSDFAELTVLRYTLHNRAARHNSGPQYGGKELFV